tara:strand:+ start:38 stop:640 length:603 start_codon:yes stop_codon:yes gene_type:complete
MIYTALKICMWKLFCAWRLPKAVVWYEARVLCLGLDGAGKTSVLQRADRNSFDAVEPTTGFHVRALNVTPDWKLDVWDIGGSTAVRPYWNKYVTFDTRAIIWVVDGSDRTRLDEASTALRALLESEVRLRAAPVLVLLNKSEIGGGLSVAEAAGALGVEQLPGLAGCPRAHHVQACSAATGQGVAEGLQWLSQTLTATLR